MIVSYEGVHVYNIYEAARISMTVVVSGVMLREVETEEEAFAEMRRYLEVNNIPSDYTEVQWREVDEKRGVFTRYKYVGMGNSKGDGASFGIYYEGHPSHLELGSEEKWGINRETSLEENKRIRWYDNLARYFQDLAERKAGGE